MMILCKQSSLIFLWENFIITNWGRGEGGWETSAQAALLTSSVNKCKFGHVMMRKVPVNICNLLPQAAKRIVTQFNRTYGMDIRNDT